VDIDTSVSIYFRCIWSTNASLIDSGTLSVNSSLYAINGTGWVEITYSSPTVVRYLWDVDGANVNGVTLFDRRVSRPEMIWDALSVSLSVQGDDYRINVGDPVIVTADITYMYDGTDSNATFALNDTTFQYFDIGQRSYSVTGISGDSYGISAIASVDPVTVVWDALVLDVIADDNHIDVGATAIVNATATYAFDGTDYDGTLTLNDTVFVLTFPGRRAYRVWRATGDSYGIDFFSNTHVEAVIWDPRNLSANRLQKP